MAIRSIPAAAVLVAFLSMGGSVSAQGALQPPSEDTPNRSSKEKETNPLLTDPSAVEIATYQCSQLTDGCPVNAKYAESIAKNFQQPLRKGDGGNTALAEAILNVLSRVPVWAKEHEKEKETPSPYAAIHLVDMRNGAEGAVHDRWILASRDGGRTLLSQKRRIFGTHRMSVVYVYVNAPLGGADPEAATKAPSEGDVKDAYDRISYRAVVKEKRSVAFEHLLAAFRLVGVAQAAGRKEPPTTVAFVGYGMLTDIPTPSDVSVIGVDTTSMTAIGQSIQYDNEGRSLWDVSVAVPVNKVSLLEYEDENDNGVFVPKQINKQSIFAVVNLYPVPVDLKEGTARWIMPRLIGGLGLTGRPGENFLVGLALGIPEMQVFAGRAFANHRVPLDGAEGAIANGASFKQEYEQSWSFGINLPVMSALKKVTAKSDKKAGEK